MSKDCVRCEQPKEDWYSLLSRIATHQKNGEYSTKFVDTCQWLILENLCKKHKPIFVSVYCKFLKHNQTLVDLNSFFKRLEN